MKIYVDDAHEIKAIYISEDDSLAEYEVDRAEVFGDMTDFMILNYCYKVTDEGFVIYPVTDYDVLVEEEYKFKIDVSAKKISVLESMLISNMIALTELYEMQNSQKLLNEIEVPTKIQETYQVLFDLKIKKLEDIPREVRKKLKIK